MQGRCLGALAKAETGPGCKQVQRASLQEHRSSRSDLTRTLERSSSAKSQHAASQGAGPGTTPTSPHGPDCPGAMLRANPAEQHLQLTSPAPAGKRKVELPANLCTRPAASPLSPATLSIPLELPPPQGCQRESLHPGHRAAVAPAGAASPAEQQEFPWLWYCMWETPEEGKGTGMGQRKQRGIQTPAPCQGMELHGLCACKRPGSRFQIPVLQPP